MRLTVEMTAKTYVTEGEWAGHPTTTRQYRNLTFNTDAMKNMTEEQIAKAAEHLGAHLAQAIMRDIKQVAVRGRLDVSWFKA